MIVEHAASRSEPEQHDLQTITNAAATPDADGAGDKRAQCLQLPDKRAQCLQLLEGAQNNVAKTTPGTPDHSDAQVGVQQGQADLSALGSSDVPGCQHHTDVAGAPGRTALGELHGAEAAAADPDDGSEDEATDPDSGAKTWRGHATISENDRQAHQYLVEHKSKDHIDVFAAFGTSSVGIVCGDALLLHCMTLSAAAAEAEVSLMVQCPQPVSVLYRFQRFLQQLKECQANVSAALCLPHCHFFPV